MSCYHFDCYIYSSYLMVLKLPIWDQHSLISNQWRNIMVYIVELTHTNIELFSCLLICKLIHLLICMLICAVVDTILWHLWYLFHAYMQMYIPIPRVCENVCMKSSFIHRDTITTLVRTSVTMRRLDNNFLSCFYLKSNEEIQNITTLVHQHCKQCKYFHI